MSPEILNNLVVALNKSGLKYDIMELGKCETEKASRWSHTGNIRHPDFPFMDLVESCGMRLVFVDKPCHIGFTNEK